MRTVVTWKSDEKLYDTVDDPRLIDDVFKKIDKHVEYTNELLNKKGIMFVESDKRKVVEVIKNYQQHGSWEIEVGYEYGEELTPKQRKLWNNFLTALSEEPVNNTEQKEA